MKSRKIKILTNGNFMLPGVGFINGPILTPYNETDANIFAMLGSGVKIVEVRPDGSEKVLTISNYKRQEGKKPVVKGQKPKQNPKVVSVTLTPPTEDDNKVEETSETKSEEVSSEVHVVDEETKQTEETKENQFKYNYKKGKKYNKSSETTEVKSDEVTE